jgi:hypothetical protein
MADIRWGDEASLMQVTDFATADSAESLVARGTAYELVGMALELPPEQHAGLMLRQTSADDVLEYDAAAIRELAAHPDYTGVAGAFDTARDGDDDALSDAADEETLVDGETSGPSHTDAHGLDGEK